MMKVRHSELIIGLIVIMLIFISTNDQFYFLFKSNEISIFYILINIIVCIIPSIIFLWVVVRKIEFGQGAILKMVFANLLLALMATICFLLIFKVMYQSLDFRLVKLHQLYGLYAYFIINSLIVVYYFSLNEKKRIAILNADLKKQLSDLKINILKYQLHPHFFYNTLNNISGLIDFDTKLAKDTLSDFADFLRVVNLMKDTNLLPLSFEINVLNKYINIMKVRYINRLRVDIEYDNDLNNVLIPSLILQPLIENSIKYGFTDNVKTLQIKINIYKQNDRLMMIVGNNGKLLDENIVFGKGLKNTKARLHSLYDEDYELKIQNITPSNYGVETMLSFPLRYDTSK